MTRAEFTRCLRAMEELIVRGLPGVSDLSVDEINDFIDFPLRTFVNADDATAAAIWREIVLRQAQDKGSEE